MVDLPEPGRPVCQTTSGFCAEYDLDLLVHGNDEATRAGVNPFETETGEYSGGGAGKDALRAMEHDARILAHRVEHHRFAELGHGLAQDVDRLVLESLQVRR